MALELDFEITFASDISTINVEDKTLAYSASNIGGWGAPNTERTDRALFLFVEYIPYTGADVDLSFTATGSEKVLDFTTDTEDVTFNINYYKDGWYKISLFAIPKYTDAAAPGSVTANNVYFSTDTSTLKFYDGASVRDVQAGDYATLYTSGYTTKKVENMYQLLLTQQLNCLQDDYMDCISTEKNCNSIEDKLVQLKFLIEGTSYRFYSSKELEAQKMVENLTKQFKCCD